MSKTNAKVCFDELDEDAKVSWIRFFEDRTEFRIDFGLRLKNVNEVGLYFRLLSAETIEEDPESEFPGEHELKTLCLVENDLNEVLFVERDTSAGKLWSLPGDFVSEEHACVGPPLFKFAREQTGVMIEANQQVHVCAYESTCKGRRNLVTVVHVGIRGRHVDKIEAKWWNVRALYLAYLKGEIALAPNLETILRHWIKYDYPPLNDTQHKRFGGLAKDELDGFFAKLVLQSSAHAWYDLLAQKDHKEFRERIRDLETNCEREYAELVDAKSTKENNKAYLF